MSNPEIKIETEAKGASAASEVVYYQMDNARARLASVVAKLLQGIILFIIYLNQTLSEMLYKYIFS